MKHGPLVGKQLWMPGQINLDDNRRLVKLAPVGPLTPASGRLVKLPVGERQDGLMSLVARAYGTAAENHACEEGNEETVHTYVKPPTTQA